MRSEDFRYLIIISFEKIDGSGIPMLRMSDIYGDFNIWSRFNGTTAVDIIVPFPIGGVAKQLLTDREIMTKMFLTKSVVYIESNDLDEFIKIDHTKGQVNLEILLSDESESDDSSVGASEAEEVVEDLSSNSDLGILTEDEDEARRSTVNVLVCNFLLPGFLKIVDT
jgi:hypothetical protein